MSDLDDQVYFAARAIVERALSKRALNPVVALIHTQLADRYDFLPAEAEADQSRPTLYLAAAR